MSFPKSFIDEINKLNLYIKYKPRTIYDKVSYSEIDPEYIDEDGKKFIDKREIIEFIKKLPFNTPKIDVLPNEIFKYDHLPPPISTPAPPTTSKAKPTVPSGTPDSNELPVSAPIKYNKDIVVIGAGPVGLWFVISLLESTDLTKIKSLTVLEKRKESEYTTRKQQFFIENEFFNNLPNDIKTELLKDPDACRIFRPNRLIKSYCYKPATVFPDEETPATSPDTGKNKYINGYSIMINKLQEVFKKYIDNQLTKDEINNKFNNKQIKFIFGATVMEIEDKSIKYNNGNKKNQSFETLVISSGKIIIPNSYGLRSVESATADEDKAKLKDLYGAAINITTTVDLGADAAKEQEVIDYFNNSDYQHRFRFFRQQGENLYLGINLSKDEYDKYTNLQEGGANVFKKGKNANKISQSSTGGEQTIYNLIATIMAAYTKKNFTTAGTDFTIAKGEFSIFPIKLMSADPPYVRKGDKNNVYIIGDAVNSPHFFSMYGVNSGFYTANKVRDIIAKNDNGTAQDEYKTFIDGERKKLVEKAIDITIDFKKCVDTVGNLIGGVDINKMKTEMKQASHPNSNIDFDKLNNVDICLMYNAFHKKPAVGAPPPPPPIAEETIKVLTYNISWEAMSANTNQLKIQTSAKPPSAKAVAEICREAGKLDVNNKCLINVAKIIEDSPELDFVGLQEATNWKLIRNKSPKLQKMKYIHHDLNKSGSRVEDLVSFYNPKKFKFIAVYVGEVENRPYQIIYLKHKVSLVIYAFINVHLPHKDVKADMQEGFKFTTANIYKLKDETKDADNAENLKIYGELSIDANVTALNNALSAVNANIKYTKNAFLNKIYNTKHIIFLGDTNDENGDIYNNFTPFDKIDPTKVNPNEFEKYAINFKKLKVSTKGTTLPQSCCNSSALKTQKYKAGDNKYNQQGDYILVSDKLDFVPGKGNVILQTLLDKNTDFEKFPTSDHLPVYAEIKLPTEDILELDYPKTKDRLSTEYKFKFGNKNDLAQADLNDTNKISTEIYNAINAIYDSKGWKDNANPAETWFPTKEVNADKASYYYLKTKDDKTIFAVTANLTSNIKNISEKAFTNSVDGKNFYMPIAGNETSGTAIMIDDKTEPLKYSLAFQELYYQYLNTLDNNTWKYTNYEPKGKDYCDEYKEIGYDILYDDMNPEKNGAIVKYYNPFKYNDGVGGEDFYYMVYLKSNKIDKLDALPDTNGFKKIQCVNQSSLSNYYNIACGLFVLVNALMITFIAKMEPTKIELLNNTDTIKYLTRYMRYVILKYAKYLQDKFPGETKYSDFIVLIGNKHIIDDAMVNNSDAAYDDTDNKYFNEMNTFITDLYDFHWCIPMQLPLPVDRYFLNIDWLESNIIIVEINFDDNSNFSDSIFCRNPIFIDKNLKIIRNFYKLNNFVITFIIGSSGHWTCYTVNKYKNAPGTIEKQFLFLNSIPGDPDNYISNKIKELLNKNSYEDFIIEILNCYSPATDNNDDKRYEKYVSYIDNMISLLLNDNVLKGKIPNYKDFVKKIITRIISVDIKYLNKSTATKCQSEIIPKLDALMVKNKDIDIKTHYYNEIIRNKDIYSLFCIKNKLDNETKTEIQKIDNSIVIAGGSRKLTKTRQSTLFNQSNQSNQSKLTKKKYNKT